MKKALILALFVFAVSFLNPASSKSFSSTNVNSSNTCSSLSVKKSVDYTYVRVLIEGVWWILVYDPDGHLIFVYPDEDE